VTALSPAAEASASQFGRRRGLRKRLQDARIRVKLGLILVIPVVAVLGLATDRIVERGQEARDTELVRSLAELSANASAVSHELHRERMSAATFLADPAAKPDQYIPQIRRTDRAVVAYLALRGELTELPTSVSDRLRRVDQQLSTLDEARQEVLTRGEITISAIVLRYGTIITDLVAYRESLDQIAGDTVLGDQLRAAAALSKTKAEMAQAQAAAFVALQSKSFDDEQLTTFLSTLTSQQESLNAFVLTATPEQRDLVGFTITGNAVALADKASSDVIRSAGRDPLITAADASRSLGAIVDLVRWTEQRIDANLLVAATDRRNTVILQVVIDSAALVVILAVALALALIFARALVRSLNELRAGSLAVANHDLPKLVARLSDRRTIGEQSPAEIVASIPDPIPLSSRDEIGQVARAFNVVHREAVRVAAEQAALHTSVSVMFFNLARRSQSLVDQMIAHLDDIERDEEDPKRLGRLFRLDHLATRMRRNDENLLVLAGADSSPPRRDDGLVVDILRAAQSEIEHYDRVDFGSVDIEAFVVARAVNDVVRLLAELFDNATRFSPPTSAVVVSARQHGDQVLIQVEDHGVGLTPEQVHLFNARLAAPPTVDISAFRMMGLAVTGRLASRYGIRVEVRSDPGEGTTVYVSLPPTILVLPRSRSYDVFGGVGSRRPVEAGWPGAPPLAVPAPSGWQGLLPPALPSSGPGRLGFHNGSEAGAGRFSPGLDHAPPPRAVDDTAEMPIYQQMRAAWFEANRGIDIGVPGAVLGQPIPPPVPTPPVPGPVPPPMPAHVPPPVPTPAPYGWDSPADEGWRAAAAAASPTVRTKTRSGLPKRVPQAQLVPGGVETPAPAADAQRTPADVRSLLSAYHGGVQRGRGEMPPASG